MDKQQRAKELFEKGYNCAQSVFGTFCEDCGIDFETGVKMTSSFGGGMGKLREVCGAVSAMFLIAGLKYGYASCNNDDLKTEHYKLIQELANEFKKEHDSIICRELLGFDSDGYVPAKRTEKYYQTRPCEQFISSAVKLIKEKLCI